MTKDRSNCPISFALDSFGDKWSLLILRDIIIMGKTNYLEFMESDEGISTNILADRLQKLEKAKMISKVQDVGNKKKFIYKPTVKGLDLLPMIIEMVQWSAKYDPKTGVPAGEIEKIEKNRKGYIRKIRAKFDA